MLQGIIELDELSTRTLFEHRVSSYAAALAYRELFGLVSFRANLPVLTRSFGVYAPVDGGVVLVPALRSSARGARKWLPLAKESVGVIAGLVALLWPGKTASGQLNVLVGWAVGTGILKLITAIVLRSEVEETGAACRRRAVDKLGRHPCGLSKLRSAPLAPSFSIPPRPLLLPDGVLRAATVLQPEPDTPEHGRIRSCLETLKTAYISQIVVRDRTPMESPELIYKEEVAGWNPSSSISSAPGFGVKRGVPGRLGGSLACLLLVSSQRLVGKSLSE